MLNQDIKNYIQKRQKEGADVSTIQEELKKAGWEESVVNAVFENAQNISADTNNIVNPEYQKFLGPVELLKKTINIIKENNKTLILLLLPAITVSIGIALLTPEITDKMLKKIEQRRANQQEVIKAVQISPLLIPSYILYVLMWIITGPTLVWIVLHRKEKPQLKEAVKKASVRILPYVEVSMLVGSTLLGAMIFLLVQAIIVYLMTLFASFIETDEKIAVWKR